MLRDDEIAARAQVLTNMPYVIYDKATGKIVRTGIAGSPKSINHKIKDGQAVVFDVQIDGRTHRIDLKTLQPVLKDQQDVN